MPTDHIKGEHYSNNLILSQNGEFLSTVGDERITWYLKRNLANEVSTYPPYKRIIKLNFKHGGSASAEEMDILPMKNCCVVCGKEDTLSLHHVVPYSVKRHYPLKYKEYTRRQCVLLCEKHHIEIEKVNKQLSENPYVSVEKHIRFIHKIIGYYARFVNRIALWFWIFSKGGIKKINASYIDLFNKEMKPQFLHKDWLKP